MLHPQVVVRLAEAGRENGMGIVWMNEIVTATENENESEHGWNGRVEMMRERKIWVSWMKKTRMKAGVEVRKQDVDREVVTVEEQYSVDVVRLSLPSPVLSRAPSPSPSPFPVPSPYPFSQKQAARESAGLAEAAEARLSARSERP